MSATFNYMLFANYFSKTSIMHIEEVDVYTGESAKMELEAAEQKKRQDQNWGGSATAEDWNRKTTTDD